MHINNYVTMSVVQYIEKEPLNSSGKVRDGFMCRRSLYNLNDN